MLTGNLSVLQKVIYALILIAIVIVLVLAASMSTLSSLVLASSSTLTLDFLKGNIIKKGTTSPNSLYSESMASFTTGELYNHHDAEGFINLFGLPIKVQAMVDGKK